MENISKYKNIWQQKINDTKGTPYDFYLLQMGNFIAFINSKDATKMQYDTYEFKC